MAVPDNEVVRVAERIIRLVESSLCPWNNTNRKRAKRKGPAGRDKCERCDGSAPQ